MIARYFFIWFYITAGIIIYVLATLLVLVSFASRIRRCGRENGSFIKTFLKLLYTHLFIFVPPIAYAISQIPYSITYNTNSKGSYFQCGISTGEFIIKILVAALPGIPIVVTWLFFVYPLRVYMTEFYLNIWSGQSLAKILLFIKSYSDKGESDHLATMNITNNEHDNRGSTV
jgi:hypothetical protein